MTFNSSILSNIHHHDSLSFISNPLNIPDKSVDLIIIDPPYNIGYKSTTGQHRKTMRDLRIDYGKECIGNNRSGVFDTSYDRITDDNNKRSQELYAEWLEKHAIQFKRILKDNGSLYVFLHNLTGCYIQVLYNKHFNLLSNIRWYKPNGIACLSSVNSKNYCCSSETILFYEQKPTYMHFMHFLPIAEYMLKHIKEPIQQNNKWQEFIQLYAQRTNSTGAITKHYFAPNQFTFPTDNSFNAMLSIMDDLSIPYPADIKKTARCIYKNCLKEAPPGRTWNKHITKNYDVIIHKTNCLDKIHPNEKPYKLIAEFIMQSSNEGDVVLDTFSGSGVVALACHNLNRKFICIEKDKRYYESSVKRLEFLRRQGRLVL